MGKPSSNTAFVCSRVLCIAELLFVLTPASYFGGVPPQPQYPDPARCSFRCSQWHVPALLGRPEVSNKYDSTPSSTPGDSQPHY